MSEYIFSAEIIAEDWSRATAGVLALMISKRAWHIDRDAPTEVNIALSKMRVTVEDVEGDTMATITTPRGAWVVTADMSKHQTEFVTAAARSMVVGARDQR